MDVFFESAYAASVAETKLNLTEVLPNMFISLVLVWGSLQVNVDIKLKSEQSGWGGIFCCLDSKKKKGRYDDNAPQWIFDHYWDDLFGNPQMKKRIESTQAFRLLRTTANYYRPKIQLVFPMALKKLPATMFWDDGTAWCILIFIYFLYVLPIKFQSMGLKAAWYLH